MNENPLKMRFKLKKYNLYELDTNDFKFSNNCFLKSQRSQMISIDKKYIGNESNFYALSLLETCIDIVEVYWIRSLKQVIIRKIISVFKLNCFILKLS